MTSAGKHLKTESKTSSRTLAQPWPSKLVGDDSVAEILKALSGVARLQTKRRAFERLPLDVVASILEKLDLEDRAVLAAVSALLHELPSSAKSLTLTRDSRALLSRSKALEKNGWRPFYNMLRLTTARIDSLRMYDWIDQLEILYSKYPDEAKVCCDMLTRQGKIQQLEIVGTLSSQTPPTNDWSRRLGPCIVRF